MSLSAVGRAAACPATPDDRSRRHRPSLPMLLAGLAPLAVLAVYAALLVRGGMGVHTPPPWPRWSFVDFRDTIWLPVRDLLAGHDPYDLPGYLARHPQAQEFSLYAPSVLLLGAPLALLPWPLAMVAWGLVLVGAFAVLVHRSALLAGLPRTAVLVPLVLAAVLITPTGNQPSSSGQYAVVAAAAVVVALSTRRASVAALATSLALVKPQVGVPLVALLLVQGRWRAAASGVGVAAVASAPAAVVLVLRAGGPAAWITTLRQNVALTEHSQYTEADRAGSTRVDVVGTLARLGLHPSGGVTLALTVSLAVATLVAARRCWISFEHSHIDDATHPVVALRWWAAVAAAMLLWTPNELYAALVALPAALLGLALIARGAGAVWARIAAALPGLALVVPFVHVHRLDAAVGIGRPSAAVNGAAICLALATLVLRTPRLASLAA